MSDKPFKPAKLPLESVEAPLEPHWRVMGAEQEKKLHEKAVAEFHRYRLLGPRMRRRLRIYVLGTAAGFAAVGWFFISGSTRALWVFGGLGALVGAVVAWLRPTDFLCGLIYAFAGVTAQVAMFRDVGGRALMMMVVLGALFFGIVGIVCGRMEEFRRLDGED